MQKKAIGKCYTGFGKSPGGLLRAWWAQAVLSRGVPWAPGSQRFTRWIDPSSPHLSCITIARDTSSLCASSSLYLGALSTGWGDRWWGAAAACVRGSWERRSAGWPGVSHAGFPGLWGLGPRPGWCRKPWRVLSRGVGRSDLHFDKISGLPVDRCR